MKTIDELLQKVAIIGAAGKMGRGIALLLLQEMARVEASLFGTVGGGKYRLILIDASEESLGTLRPYLRSYIKKYAEKQINLLRGYFKDHPHLVSNREVIDYFVDGAMDILFLDPHLEGAYHASLIFEAIVEEESAKESVFASIASGNKGEYYLFTNTSSIPIHILNRKSNLNKNIIGFHFYNPPAVQKLIEVIPISGGDPALTTLAKELSKRLGKIVVISKDVAGFIGNGHFLREVTFACKQVEDLQQEGENSLEAAICLVNYATQELLIRPMGIFQLLDYVGLDVAELILGVMRTYLDDPLKAPLIQRFLSAGIRGGQNPDGSQKDGIFLYEKGVPVAVFSLGKGQYEPIAIKLSSLPSGHQPWKVVVKESKREVLLKNYLENLYPKQSPEAQVAKEFLQFSRAVADQLVQQGVAQSEKDVEAVLQNGFYHVLPLGGP